MGAVFLVLNRDLGWWQVSPVVNYILLGIVYYMSFMCGTNLVLNVYRLIGYEVAEFFGAPAFAQSPGEFWRRWNKPMHEWLMDNVYHQLTGHKRLYTGIPLVFAVSGLCHEYTISLASGTINGFMMTFFLIQSFMFVLSIFLHDLLSANITDYKNRKDLALLRWTATMTSIVVPGVLFVHNLETVFALHTIRIPF